MSKSITNKRSKTEAREECFGEFSTDSTYLQSSSSGSDDSYVRTRKKYRNEWFVGLGNKECIIDENANNKAEDDKMTNASEVLSLNHIFLFEEDSKVGIRGVLDGNLIKKFFDEINAAFVFVQLSDDDVLKCNNMSRTAAGTYKSCKTLLRN